MENYDGPNFVTRRAMVLGEAGGLTVGGTNAANTEIHRVRFANPSKVETVDIVAMTGGTAAGPALLIGKSLAGTGTVANFATHTFGTDANNTAAGLTVATTDFADGDHLVISKAAGTAASSPKVSVNIGWREDFDTTN
jgi:hypothetical protein